MAFACSSDMPSSSCICAILSISSCVMTPSLRAATISASNISCRRVIWLEKAVATIPVRRATTQTPMTAVIAPTSLPIGVTGETSP